MMAVVNPWRRNPSNRRFLRSRLRLSVVVRRRYASEFLLATSTFFSFPMYINCSAVAGLQENLKEDLDSSPLGNLFDGFKYLILPYSSDEMHFGEGADYSSIFQNSVILCWFSSIFQWFDEKGPVMFKLSIFNLLCSFFLLVLASKLAAAALQNELHGTAVIDAKLRAQLSNKKLLFRDCN